MHVQRSVCDETCDMHCAECNTLTLHGGDSLCAGKQEDPLCIPSECAAYSLRAASAFFFFEQLQRPGTRHFPPQPM
jgi:hypothetical protein